MNYNNKLKLIHSFDFENVFSRSIFDENNNGYFLEFSESSSKYVIKSINNLGEVSVVTEVEGKFSGRVTLSIFQNIIILAINNLLYAYSKEGIKCWKIELTDEIWSITPINHTFIVKTTKELFWISKEGTITQSHDTFRINGNPIPTKNRIFCIFQDRVELYDHNGNYLTKVNIGEADSPIKAPKTNIENTVLHVFDSSNGKLITIDESGNIIKQLDLTDVIKNYHFQLFSFTGISNELVLLEQKTIWQKTLCLIDAIGGAVINSFETKGNFENLPVWNKDGLLFGYIHFSRNKNSLIIFDEKLNVIEEIKKSGEIYQLTFDKEDNLYVNLYDRRNCKIKFYRLSK